MGGTCSRCGVWWVVYLTCSFDRGAYYYSKPAMRENGVVITA